MPVEEIIERDPALRAAFAATPDKAGLLEYIEQVRLIVYEVWDDHACLDPHGWIRDGKARQVAFSLRVRADPDDDAVWLLDDVEVPDEPDGEALRACLLEMFGGVRLPRRVKDGDAMVFRMRWGLTGAGIESIYQ